jgi:hypothetical protein
MRQVTETVSQWNCGRYFFYFCGDEILLNATTDAAAIQEAEQLAQELA